MDSSRVLRAHEYLMETLSTPRGLGNHRHMPLGPVYIPAWESGSSLRFRAEGTQFPTGI